MSKNIAESITELEYEAAMCYEAYILDAHLPTDKEYREAIGSLLRKEKEKKKVLRPNRRKYATTEEAKAAHAQKALISYHKCKDLAKRRADYEASKNDRKA